jgi:hypothetical protein
LRRTNPEIRLVLEAASLLGRLLFCGFCRRRIDFRDLAKAIGLGVVRSGDERAAHFRAVPSGSDAKPNRLFDLNVARRKFAWRITFSLALDHRTLSGFRPVGANDLCSAVVGEPRKVRKYSRD